MDKYPLVTIGVSAYNRKDYLQECLDSLLAQSYPACEIIVIDDGSTDGTGAMMQEKYPQIKYVYQENAGDAAAKNHAAKLAQGQYIVFNDSDDVFLPDAVERLYNAVKDQEKGAISYGTYITIDPDGNKLPTKRKAAVFPSGKILSQLLQHIIVCNCGTLIPLDVFKKAGMFNADLKVSYDYALFMELSLKSNFYAVQEPVFLRRRHGSNLSGASYAKILTVSQIFEDFVSRHPESMGEFAGIIRRRRGDFHNKLYREARREKLKKEAVYHASEAFKYHPSIKTFFRMLSARL